MPLDASVIDADANLAAPDLKIQQGTAGSIEVKSLRVKAVAQKGTLDYDATAESLGGKVVFHGSAPIVGDLNKALADAQLQAAGFRLGEVWKGLGMVGGLSHLDGLGAINTNLRARIHPFQLFGRGIFELRDLHYGRLVNLGNLHGNASITPTSWSVDQVKGELLGGVASGEAHSEYRPGGSKVIAFDFKVDRASLVRMTSEVPSLCPGRSDEVRDSSQDRRTARGDSRGERGGPGPPGEGVWNPHRRLTLSRGNRDESALGHRSGERQTLDREDGGRFGSRERLAASGIGSNVPVGPPTERMSTLNRSLETSFHRPKRPASGKVSGKISLTGPNPEHTDKIREEG